MSNYVENNYVDSGYVEGDSVIPSNTVICDLTVVNIKLDLILTKLSAISNSVSALDSRLTTIENDVNGISVPDFSNSLNLVNEAIADTRNFLTTKVLTVDNANDILPFVNEMSLRIYPNGTKVDVIGVDGICTVLSSALTPNSDYEFIAQYTVKLDDSGRISQFPAPVVTKHIDGV